MKFFSTFCWLSGLFCILVYNPSTFAVATQEDHILSSLESLYMKNYNAVSTNKTEKKIDTDSIAVIARQTDIPEEIIRTLVSGTQCSSGECAEKVRSILEEKCPISSDLLTLYSACEENITKAFKAEQERQIFLERQYKYALGSQVFVNGTLRDTNGEMFDIIVDLNIIDRILFGSNATVPSTSSPFFARQAPENANDGSSDTNGDTNTNTQNSSNNDSNSTNTDSQNINSDSTSNTNQSNSSSNTSNTLTTNSDSNNTQTNTSPENDPAKEFCTDPDALYFTNTSNTNTTNNSSSDTDTQNNQNSSNTTNNQNNQNVSTNENNSLSTQEDLDASLGNFFSSQANTFGSQYPDITKFKDTNNCESDEEEFLGGRICIPKFCNEIICIKISMTPGYRKTESLRTQNCIECHIERANKALEPMIAMIGKNTPNDTPTEPYFLSAFANLFKNVTNGITIHNKRLPFLVYDTPLSKQKSQENISTQEKKQDAKIKTDREIELQMIEKQKENMKTIREKCERIDELFSSQPSMFRLVEYCNKIQQQQDSIDATSNTQIQELLVSSPAEIEQDNYEKSQTYHNIVQPFFTQISRDMVFMNTHIMEINPQEIEQNKISCTIKTK